MQYRVIFYVEETNVECRHMEKIQKNRSLFHADTLQRG